jgi:hypothetical protein
MRAFHQHVAAKCKTTRLDIMLTMKGPPFHAYLATASMIAIAVDRDTFSGIIILMVASSTR